MKHLLAIGLAIGILMVSTSCKIIDAIVDSSGPLPRLPNWGYLTADMNKADWSLTYKNGYQVTHGIVSYSDEPQGVFFALKSILYTPDGAEHQELLFQKIPFAAATARHRVTSCLPFTDCQVNEDVQAVLHTCNDDVGLNSYYIIDSEDNYIQIDRYNKKNQEVKGTFQLTFAVRKNRSPGDPLPDTLRFRNGRFHTKIIRYKARGE